MPRRFTGPEDGLCYSGRCRLRFVDCRTENSGRLSPKVGELTDCYVNRSWEQQGLAHINCLYRMPNGECASARFVVDTWCLGLKDAGGQLSCTRRQFRRLLEITDTDDTGFVEVKAAVAKRLVAGGIRLATENGFRLPRRYQCWTAVLGDLGDIDAADVSDFCPDGRLRFRGGLDELQSRLESGEVEEFLSRDDVDVLMVDCAGSAEDHTDESDVGERCSTPSDAPTKKDQFCTDDISDAFESPKSEYDLWQTIQDTADILADEATTRIRQWCFANRIPPSPRLDDAWDLQNEALLQTPDLLSVEDDSATDSVESSNENIERLLSMEEAGEQNSLRRGLEQIEAFMSQFDTPEAMMDALGLDEAPENPAYHY